MKKLFIYFSLSTLIIFINVHADTICLDPGHGGYAVGTPGYNPPPYEKDVNLEYALELEYWLSFSYFSFNIFITRNTDVDVSHSARVEIANGERDDANGVRAPAGGTDEFLSIHCNAAEYSPGVINPNVHGTECYVWTASFTNTPPTNTEEFAFASEMITSYINETFWEYSNARIVNGDADGIKGEDFYVLEYLNMPGILLEMEFLTSNDAYYPLTDWYHNNDYSYVNAAVDGMINACNWYSPVISSVGPEKPGNEISGFQLQENYPNPFNPITTIKYDIKKVTIVELKIFNTNGQLIKTIINDHKSSGSYSAVWDGTNNNGFSVASGTYICRLRAGDYRKSIKLALLR